MPRNEIKELTESIERIMRLMMNDPLRRFPRSADIGEPRRIIRSVPKPEPAKAPAKEQPVREPEKVPA